MLNTSLVLFGIFIILLCTYLILSLGIASIVGIVVTGLPIEMFPINVFSASSKFSLLAIPFYRGRATLWRRREYPRPD